MSRKKQNLDEVEQLQLEVRKLKSENRHLQKELKKNNKKYKPQHNKNDLLEEDHSPKKMICDECGKGEIVVTELGPRKLIHCTVCQFRKTLKVNNG
jgi:FtsZ-binding cell division protein ZapB